MTDAINAAIAGALLVFAAWAIRRSIRAVIRADRAVNRILHGDPTGPDTAPGSDLQLHAACRAIAAADQTARKEKPQP